MTNPKFLFAKFSGKEILLEQGRLLYSLLNAFSSTGYRISLFNNLAPDSLEKYGKLVFSLEGLTLIDSPPTNPEDWIYLYDKEDKALGKYEWRKKIEVRDDLFSSYCFKNPVIMPFPVHPVHSGPDLEQRLQQCRGSEKKVRVFFSGDTKNYGRNRIRYPKAKLPRLEVINTVLERMGDDAILVKDLSTLSELHDSAYTNKCVIVDTSRMWIDDREWLRNLAKADFFLGPPGIVMPMCHNIVEAMAVGTVPITNYPEWFDPKLTHMENCIAFDDKDDLINKIRSVLEMGADQIARMQANALGHYETHLRASAFTRGLELHPDRRIIVLIYTEGNVARNWAKLNKRSILMRGTIPSGDKGWVGRVSECLFPRES
ncbi:MAG TPA: glycosyltransferase [Gammaproteobacteria bacterium]|nr:glycosyltransferase [Gammaproteobacteria bacterium]